MEEGLATYVEPVARARAGELPVAKVWADLVEDLPKGLPAPGDRGLDHTRTWGRTYWGGALFWLLADVEIRSLRELYDRMAVAPAPVDLAAPWRRLGVVPGDRRITFDDRAPLATVRRAITEPNGSRPSSSSPAPMR